MTEIALILTTVPETHPDKVDLGNKIAKVLVEEGLAACVNIITGIKSVYCWKEQLCQDSEKLLLIKAANKNINKIESKIREIHSYEIFEFIVISPDKVGEDYAKWILSKSLATGCL